MSRTAPSESVGRAGGFRWRARSMACLYAANILLMSWASVASPTSLPQPRGTGPARPGVASVRAQVQEACSKATGIRGAARDGGASGMACSSRSRYSGPGSLAVERVRAGGLRQALATCQHSLSMSPLSGECAPRSVRCRCGNKPQSECDPTDLELALSRRENCRPNLSRGRPEGPIRGVSCGNTGGLARLPRPDRDPGASRKDPTGGGCPRKASPAARTTRGRR